MDQSFHSFEVIIVDGVSSDTTLSIVKKYAEIYSNIRWLSEKDNGIYDAMNKGIKMAKGDWIFFLGSDDKLTSSSILQEIFDNEAKNKYKVVYGNARLVGDTSWAKDGEIYDGEFTLKKITTKNICHQAIFYNLEYLKNQIGFYNIKYKLCADWDLNLRCWADRAFLYQEVIIADFYGGGESTKTNRDEEFNKDFTSNLIKYFGIERLKLLLSNAELLRFGIVQKKTIRSSLKKFLFSK